MGEAASRARCRVPPAPLWCTSRPPILVVRPVVLPTKRVVYGRDVTGHRVEEPVLVSIDLDNVKVS